MKICEYLKVCCERIPESQRDKWFIRLLGAKKREFYKVVDIEETANVGVVAASFSLSVTDRVVKAGETKSTKHVCKIDFEKANKSRKNIGNIGERIVYEYERKKLTDLGLAQLAKKVEIVAKTIGDGLGYDVLSFDSQGNELHIEVKTTTSRMTDGFYITKNELDISEKDPCYVIYRIFGLNVDNGSADMFIYEMPLDKTKYKFEPTGYRVLAL